MRPMMPTATQDLRGAFGSDARDGAPRVGDVWVVAWDNQDLGLVLVAAVREGYVLQWPITSGLDLVASAPAFFLDVADASIELVVWPEAESGMSSAVLSECIASAVITDEAVRDIRDAVWSQESLPDSVRYAEVRDDSEADEALAIVCKFAGSLCDIEWTAPMPGRSPLDPVKLSELGIGARQVRVHTPALAPASVTALVAGRKVAPLDAVRALADSVSIRGSELLGPIAGPEVGVIDDPSRKSRIVSIARKRGLDEAFARAQVWDLTQRAARAVSDAGISARVDQAIDDLLREH